jgi:uncharacterized protein YggE
MSVNKRKLSMKHAFCVMSLAWCLAAAPAFAETPDFPHIATTGFGEVVATPDMAEFSVKVVQSKPSAEQAKQAVDNVVDAFLGQLVKQGIKREDIQSSNLRLSPQYHYPEKGQPELSGYRASRSVTVQVHVLENLNDTLDLAMQSGINQVDNIRLKIKEHNHYQQLARQAAIEDAKAKAISLAKGFNQQLDKVWKIEYRQPHSQPVVMRNMTMDSQAESKGYQDSSIVIRDRVDVIYKMND